MEHVNIAILANRDKIKRLFNKYGIDEEVSLHTVELALDEVPEFEADLVNCLKSYANYEGEPQKSGGSALDWFNSILGGGTALTGTVLANKNSGSGSTAPGATTVVVQQPTADKSDSKTNTKLIIFGVVLLLLAVAAYLFVSKKK